jgi:hypothetical protein
VFIKEEMKLYTSLYASILLGVSRRSHAIIEYDFDGFPPGVADDTGFLPPTVPSDNVDNDFLPPTVPSDTGFLPPLEPSENDDNENDTGFLPRGICYDDKSFFIHKDISKTCDWIGRQKGRRLRLCERYYIAENCARTCHTCCGDDATYKFKTNFAGRKDCEWLGMKQVRKDKYCTQTLGGHKVKQKCSASCGLCEPEAIDSGTNKTSALENRSPSPSPSVSGSPTSFACEDDKSFFINNDSSKTCDWIGSKDLRRSKKCDKHYIEIGCARTCRSCCGDDEAYKFMTNSNVMKSCAWLGQNESRVERYCDQYDVQQKCTLSCGMCEPSDRIITLPATNFFPVPVPLLP